MAIPNSKVLRLQIVSLCVAGYAVVNILVIELLGDYLFHDGLILLVSLFFVPLTGVLIVFTIFFKKTFNPGMKTTTKKPHLTLAKKAKDENTASFFPEGIEARMASRELRPELAKLHGELIAGTEEETLPLVNEFLHQNNPSFLAGCGDIISKNLLKTDFYPDVIIIDGQTCRHDVEEHIPSSYQHRTVENVIGGVTKNAWLGIKDVIGRHERTVIEVTGKTSC